MITRASVVPEYGPNCNGTIPFEPMIQKPCKYPPYLGNPLCILCFLKARGPAIDYRLGQKIYQQFSRHAAAGDRTR